MKSIYTTIMVLKFFDKVKNFSRPRPNFAKRISRRAKIGGEFEGRKIFARLPKRSPAALLVQSRTQQKSFLFLLEEKEIARQIKKCEENFFTEQRAKRAAAGRSKFAVRIFVKKSSDFGQNPNFENWRCVLNEIRTYFSENPDADFLPAAFCGGQKKTR